MSIVPPNGDRSRALFVWGKEWKYDELIPFCILNNINTVLLDIYPWLGLFNRSQENNLILKKALRLMNSNGIDVLALCGNDDFPVNQKWVIVNIISQLNEFKDAHNIFKGFVFDIEYWTKKYNLLDYIPAFCRLLVATKDILKIPVGVFVSNNLLDESRDKIMHEGVDCVDGQHLIRSADLIFVGSYSNIAKTTLAQPGQIDMANKWMNLYKANQGCYKRIWLCSETLNVEPSWITYYGKTKREMDAEHTEISRTFNLEVGSPYMGQAIHCYSSYKDMLY